MVTHTELVVTSTGELLTAIDIDRSTGAEVTEWLASTKFALEQITDVDEVNQVDAWLAAVERRWKQIGKDVTEVQRTRIYVFRRLGQLYKKARQGNPRPSGANQYTKPEVTSSWDEVTSISQVESNRRWASHKIDDNWEKIEPVLSQIKNPSVKGVVREILRMEAKAPTADGGEARITLSRWEDWLPAQPDCDLLLTDPPYATDVDDIGAFAAGWLPVALAKVKSTGRAYVCVGAYPHELAAYLTIPPPPHLVLSQVLVWTYRNTLGPTPKHDYKLNWQAILYYRGMDARPLDAPEMLEQFSVQDINAPDGRQGDRWHAWQKPDKLAERFVRHATEPGDLILDPFAGTGTHLLAAAKLGRRGYGCDANPETFEIARQRGCADAI